MKNEKKYTIESAGVKIEFQHLNGDNKYPKWLTKITIRSEGIHNFYSRALTEEEAKYWVDYLHLHFLRAKVLKHFARHLIEVIE